MRTLILGDGLLGSEIYNQTEWDFISRKKDSIDVSDFYSWSHKMDQYDIIINCIANTNTYSTSKDEHWNINYKFVLDLINYTNDKGKKLVHISTDYIYTGSIENVSEKDVPVHCNNWYGYTKLLGDGLIQLMSKNYLLCRCTHKPNPFPYESAWIDQIGNFDYVDKISLLIIKLINEDKFGVYNVGTETKNMYELAKQTKEVTPINSPSHVPKNTSMSLDKLKRPFFSITIPAYGYNGKGSEFLEHSLKIISNQTFKDYEVIISDHSTDNTIKDICDRWKDKLNIIHFFNERGRGIISPNINECMKNCNGEWIKILFQDDFIFDKNSLQKQYDYIKRNTNLIWFFTQFYHSNDGVNYYNHYYPRWNSTVWTGNNTLGCPSGLTLKNNDLIFFDENLNWLMDCDFYQRMFLKYGEPSVLNEITVVNRTWGSRLTDTIPQSLKDKEFNILKLKYDKTT
jgi:dTDP-4-dehydrorhamnose reductase